ncbi:Chromate resistance protein ChrB [Citrobacter freundii]
MKLHILILTLPTEQATLRMRVWRALKNTGAAMLRDGVYLLPEAQQSHEIFNEMSREISGEGGTAFVFDAETSDEEKIRPLFDRSQQYLILMESLQVCKNDLNEETAVSQLKMVRKLRRELDRIVAIDFFPGEAQAQAIFALSELEAGINRFISPGEPHAVSGLLTRLKPEDFHNRIWATRRRPWIETGLPAPGLYGVLSTRMRSFSGLRMATIARKRRWGLILMARPSATSTIV